MKNRTPNWSEWGEWMPCSHKCGDGIRHRYRGCEANPDGSITCLTESSDSEPCYMRPCSEDIYDYWADWSSCSITCGGEGIRERKRHCATTSFRYTDEFPLAKPCYDNPGTELEPCYSPVCLEPIASFHNGAYNIRDPNRQFLTTTTTSTTTTWTTTTTSTTSTTSTSTEQLITTLTYPQVNRSAVIVRVSVLYFFLPVLAFLILLALCSCCFGTPRKRRTHRERCTNCFSSAVKCCLMPFKSCTCKRKSSSIIVDEGDDTQQSEPQIEPKNERSKFSIPQIKKPKMKLCMGSTCCTTPGCFTRKCSTCSGRSCLSSGCWKGGTTQVTCICCANKARNEETPEMGQLGQRLGDATINTTSRQLCSIPPSFRSESIHLPPTVQSHIGSRNDIIESRKETITFGDEPDLTSHRWSNSVNSPTPVIEPPSKFESDQHVYERFAAIEPSESSLLAASDIEDPEIVEIMNQTDDTHLRSSPRPSLSRQSTKKTKRMSWLRGEIETLKAFPTDRVLKSFKRMKIFRRKSRVEAEENEALQPSRDSVRGSIPRVKEIIIPNNPFESTPSEHIVEDHDYAPPLTPIESKQCSVTSVHTSCSDLRFQFMTDALVQTHAVVDLEEYDKILLESTRQLPVQEEENESELSNDSLEPSETSDKEASEISLKNSLTATDTSVPSLRSSAITEDNTSQSAVGESLQK